ncbi:hypothetical protein BDF20DRAFT_988452 [Mycotypha africana]|uniref:uncharacterized protein n=1 Tax=Mycotypha africana TaxID=64632 RepID=UPI002301986F|nr:uncharacterized protein BDF20DRAFT_988452 [Mycotypha africana]KAI8977513.1 hypothetical protein BDF20DRAFT_988452 [Mycotypha africana]
MTLHVIMSASSNRHQPHPHHNTTTATRTMNAAAGGVGGTKSTYSFTTTLSTSDRNFIEFTRCLYKAKSILNELENLKEGSTTVKKERIASFKQEVLNEWTRAIRLKQGLQRHHTITPPSPSPTYLPTQPYPAVYESHPYPMRGKLRPVPQQNNSSSSSSSSNSSFADDEAVQDADDSMSSLSNNDNDDSI